MSRPTNKSRWIGIGVVAAALFLPTAAGAHITVNPEEVPAGSFPRMDVRVPNEIAEAATDKVEVSLPDGIIFASYEPVPGWEAKVKMEKLDEPVEAYGETYKEQVGSITWTATDPDAGIGGGQFRDFGLEVGVPGEAGDVLTFPAVQTYDNGEVVRWIGDPDSEEPAPTVTLAEAGEEHSHSEDGESHEAGEEETGEVTEDVTVEEGGSGAPTWLAILGVVLGVVGIGVGGTALSRRG